jgi:regulator of sigma E protease
VAAATNVYALKADVNNVVGLKTLNLDPKEHLVIGVVKEGSAAEAAGMMANDEILAFAGVPIGGSEELTNLVQACGGKKTAIVVKRDEKRLTFEVTPRLDPKAKSYLLGILFAPPDRLDLEIEHPTPLAQVQRVWDQLCGTLFALMHSHESGVKAKDLSGPVGIFSMLALQFNTDYRLALSFLVMLNINLALLNMFPFPVLDGGHVVMSILERIRRRPLDARLVESMTTVFAILLIVFMFYVSYYDIRRISLFRSLFGMHTHIEQSANPGSSPPSSQPAP